MDKKKCYIFLFKEAPPTNKLVKKREAKSGKGYRENSDGWQFWYWEGDWRVYRSGKHEEGEVRPLKIMFI